MCFDFLCDDGEETLEGGIISNLFNTSHRDYFYVFDFYPQNSSSTVCTDVHSFHQPDFTLARRYFTATSVQPVPLSSSRAVNMPVDSFIQTITSISLAVSSATSAI